jgi:hypothetical protein
VKGNKHRGRAPKGLLDQQNARAEAGGSQMRYLKYLALLTILMVPLAYSQAQVGVAVGVGGVGVAVGPGYAAGTPVCSYGYYDYYPYSCAPYGFYGPNYFVNGIFIGAGPWFRGGWGRGYGRPGFVGRGYYGRPGYVARGGYNRGYARGYARGEFHGGNAFHGGGGFHGGGFHGGGRR